MTMAHRDDVTGLTEKNRTCRVSFSEAKDHPLKENQFLSSFLVLLYFLSGLDFARLHL